MNHYQQLLASILLTLLSCELLAEADGPDFFKSNTIPAGYILNIHDKPDTMSSVIGIIPGNSVCIRNLGCQGGLTLDEFTTLSEAEQAQRLQESPRWCNIDFQGNTGWVSGAYLAEGYCDQNTLLEEDSRLPAFDCRRANGSVEELICKDASLAQLDRQMNGIFSAALQRYRADNYEDPRPEQRGWIKGRNDCWKADDVRECVVSSYRYRIAELQIQYGQLEVPSPVYYECGDAAVTAVFYPQTLPPAVVLSVIPEIHGVSQVLSYREPSGSGAKYEGRNVSFWEHQGEAQLVWHDKQFACRLKNN